MVEGKPLIIVLYVDDLMLTSDDQLIQSRKEDLAGEFEMNDMGLMHYFLGMKVWQKMVKYLCLKAKGVKLHGFTDVDWAGSPSDHKRTSGGIFNLGSAVVSWYSRKQRSIAHSSAEAEYMAASQAVCEAIWMRKILVGLFGERMDPTMIYYDNQHCIKLSKNPIFHDKSKHIDIRYHHLQDCVVKRIMLLLYVLTKEEDADILTKALPKCKFEFHRDRIGVTDNPFLIEREC
eukprot:PITA_33515